MPWCLWQRMRRSWTPEILGLKKGCPCVTQCFYDYDLIRIYFKTEKRQTLRHLYSSMGRTSPSVWCCGWHQLSFSLESTLNLSAAKGVSPNSILTCSLSSDSPVSMWEFLSCMQCQQSLILTVMVFSQCFLQVLPLFAHFSAEKKNRAIFTSSAEVTPALQPN